MVAVLDATVRPRARQADIRPEAAAGDRPGEDLGTPQRELTGPGRDPAAVGDRTPVLGDGAGGRVTHAERGLRSRQHARRSQHRGRERQFGEVMPGLRINDRKCAQPESRILEGASAQGDVGLGLGEIPALDIHAGLVTEGRDRRRERAGGREVGDGGRGDEDARERRYGGGHLRAGDGGQQRGQQQAKQGKEYVHPDANHSLTTLPGQKRAPGEPGRV